MKKIKILLAIITASILCGCESEEVPLTAATDTFIETSTTEASAGTVTGTSEVIDNEASEIVVLDAITFGEANERANSGYSEEMLRKSQYQEGIFNVVSVEFNGEELNEDTYDEFISLIRSSENIAAFDEDTETLKTVVIMFNDDTIRFTEKKLTNIMVNSITNFPIKYSVLGVNFGDDVEAINTKLGTEFVDYPELTTLTIRDEASPAFIQFFMNEGRVTAFTVRMP
jgi:hypothetical protein